MSNSDLMSRERQEKIVELVDEHGRLTVAEICEIFDVSEATVRRDLAALSGQNLIRRVHGGAMKHQTVATTEMPILQRQSSYSDVKNRIGKAAAELINNNETLLLIGGSTGLAVAHHLQNHQNLTIVTDSLLVATELLEQQRHVIIMLGGTLNPDEYAVRGTLSRIILSQLQVDKVIIGTKAISPDIGLSVETPEEAELWRSYIEIGHHVILVTDSSKFKQSALVQAVPIEHIHTLVTDNDLSESIARKIHDKGVYLLIV